MKNGTSGRSEYRFDARSQNFFESEGYLVIRNALTSEQVTELNQAIDLVYEQQKAEDRLERKGKLNLRNSIIHHDAFLQLLDMPTAAPLAWQILNWNIQMITTHLIVLPPSKEPDDNVKYKIGSHRDGGFARAELIPRRGYAPTPPRPLVGPHRPTPRPRGAHVRALASCDLERQRLRSLVAWTAWATR